VSSSNTNHTGAHAAAAAASKTARQQDSKIHTSLLLPLLVLPLLPLPLLKMAAAAGSWLCTLLVLLIVGPPTVQEKRCMLAI
jgi:hypothetical protein